MSIRFTPNDWERVKENYNKWWNYELERPLIPLRIYGRDPGRPMPSAPLLSQENCTDLSVAPKDLIDRLDYELSCYEFLGDSFPAVNLNAFGPGIVAGFLGARVDNSTGSVWFHPKEILPIKDIHFEYDPDNIWLNRIKDICYEGMKRWQGQVLITMPDLGGVLDVLSTFRPSEYLLFDLYDDPEEVKRLTWEIHDLWWRFYEEINSILQPYNPGYSDWSLLYSETPSYILQCDFCYMIGPDFFDEFVKPELEASCRNLSHSMYHLDGIGQLNHLDSLLTIPELGAVQWIPGTGRPIQCEWPEVMCKIQKAGKNMQIFGTESMDKLVPILGSTKGLQLQELCYTMDKKNDALEYLKRYNAI